MDLHVTDALGRSLALALCDGMALNWPQPRSLVALENYTR